MRLSYRGTTSEVSERYDINKRAEGRRLTFSHFLWEAYLAAGQP